VNHLLGGVAALSSAALFALASILYRRLGRKITPAVLNLAKGAIAVVLTVGVLAATGFEIVPAREAILLGISGILGIALGDTAYFAALNRLGARRTLVLDSISPAITAGLAMVVLGERLTPMQWAGVALTLSGISWVLRERVPDDDASPTAVQMGLILGLTAIACHASGVVLSKVALDVVPALEASLVRQMVGVVGLGFYLGASQKAASTFSPLRDRANIRVLFIASFCGTFLGIWFAMVALKLTSASLATTLNATGPLFVLPLSRLMDGERISTRAVLGAVVAVAGVAVLLWS